MDNKSNKHIYILWLVVTFFYCYQYILRASPNVMQDILRINFQINAEQFATLGAFYLFGYSALQIPLGILVDRLGVQLILILSITLTCISTMLFAYSIDFWQVQLARLLTGIGSASAFMCALKVTSDHFPIGKRGLLIGATLTAGTIGAMISGYVVSEIMAQKLWRDVLFDLSIIGFGILVINIAVFYGALIRGKSIHQLEIDNIHKHGWSHTLTCIKNILYNREIMLYSLFAVGLFSPLAALTDLWGSAFLCAKYNIVQSEATKLVTIMFLGLAVGSLLIPYLFEKYNLIDQGIAVCTIAITLLLILIIYTPINNKLILAIMLLLLGVLCGAEMLCFTGAITHSTPNNSGEIIGVVNTMNMLAGGIIQYCIGFILEYVWSGKVIGGISHYDIQEFKKAMSVIMILMVLCTLLSIYKLMKIPNKKIL